uniref:Uncharacterized protein n=1 Tax=Tanacetum cinerariifolium TaxID=118510 RepID=A0A699HHG5_TANCI|nr:hypothetical protein [Tanacetum cinerariifolium]
MVVGECHEPNSEGSGSAWKAYMNAMVAVLFLLVLLEYPNDCRQPLEYVGNVHKTFHGLAKGRYCLVLTGKVTGSLKEDSREKLEVEVTMVEEKGERSSSVSKNVWGEVKGMENKSSVGSKLMASGKECLDGWVRASGGEVKGSGVVFRVSRILLGVIPRDIMGENGGETLGVDGGAD